MLVVVLFSLSFPMLLLLLPVPQQCVGFPAAQDPIHQLRFVTFGEDEIRTFCETEWINDDSSNDDEGCLGDDNEETGKLSDMLFENV